MFKIIAGVFLGLSVCATAASAQELVQDQVHTYKAKVVEITKTFERPIYEGRTMQGQTVRVEILDGDRKGETVMFDNDYIILKEGQRFYLNHFIDMNEVGTYMVFDVERKPQLLFLFLFFAICVVALGGLEGARSLVALGISIAVIVTILIPALVAGYNPLIISSLVGSLILAVAIYSTHGLNMHSTIALAGTVGAVIVTSILAFLASSGTSLTGKADEVAAYLDLNAVQGQFNFFNLLIASMIIGALGVLDDIAITQVAVVSELYTTDKTLSRFELYRRALRVGRAHVGALVNTLVLAYVGVALPSVMLMFQNKTPLLSIINIEYFATEIVRALVGSIGLIFAVPLTTALAVYILYGRKNIPQFEAHDHPHGHAHHHHA
jgi:uncharacterized membrane protein